jgi:lysyl-tRNA synthetase class 2
MKVTVSSEVFTRFNARLKIILVDVKNIDNMLHVKESRLLLREVEELIRMTFNKDTIKTHGLISPWVSAQQEFGSHAKHYKTSVEHYISFVLRKKDISTINTITNLIRYLSLKYLVPMGGDDVTKVRGNLTFDVAKGGERVDLIHTLKKGAFYYHDDKGVLGTKLDYWKSSKTMLDRRSKRVLIHLEVLPPLSMKKEKELLNELSYLIKTFCLGKVVVNVLDKKKRCCVI